MLRHRFFSGAPLNVPIYEYACRRCEHQFETIQKASEEPLSDCPECGEPALRKLLSAPVFRLKGSGWYETDFKTGDKRNVTDGAESRDNGESTDKPAAEGTKTQSGGGEAASTRDKANGKQDKKTDAQSSSTSGGGTARDAG